MRVAGRWDRNGRSITELSHGKSRNPDMAPRANWKGFLKVGELSCPVALYTAASSSDRIAFHTLNRETGHRVKRQFFDPETGEAVGPEQQAKGYEIGKDEYVMLDPEEVAAVVPES